MAPTHVAVGLLLAAPVAAHKPELAPLAAAVAGSVFPDLDLLVGRHRKSLHFPVYSWLLALPAVAAAAALRTPWSVSLGLFLLAAALHPAVDLLGGSSEPAPWEYATDRGVYLHLGGRWLAPKRWVRYDGAPEDLALAVCCTVPALVVFDGPARAVALGSLAVGVGYAAARKRIPQLSGRFPGAVLWIAGLFLSRLRR
ncbi:hypothetical protein [Halegenticoccus soli]|uniref:hypothetical protein n=1 Tax=Halegenticoccus soli TaxID=1985678 RepID=UPI000C6EE8EA|nr:hypothetical protein [Halegenticoccus soli]